MALLIKVLLIKKPVISSYLECLYKTFGQVRRNLSIFYVCIVYWLYPKLILKQRNLSLSLRQNTEITDLSSESQVLKLSQKWIYVKRDLTEEVFMKSIFQRNFASHNLTFHVFSYKAYKMFNTPVH